MISQTIKRLSYAATICLGLSACSDKPTPSGNSKLPDEFSFANTQTVINTHFDLDIHVSFADKVVRGSNEITLKWLDDSADHRVQLDIRDIKVQNAYYWSEQQWQPVKFAIEHADRPEGQLLALNLPSASPKIKVEYQTVPTASGLQWLTPEQTAGKQYPFMFSQSQAIHARSWIPLQDTPSARVTFSAKVSTDQPLTVVMGADNSDSIAKLSAQSKPDAGTRFSFTMPQAIPSYLIAIAVGDLVYEPMSPRTGIFSEPSVVRSSVAEFNETEQMIKATEVLYGAYDWGQYDLLILPPSFPYGGMENPRLSFITPTVIAGDKSLVSLIAHELAHSWSGNLVTNANWRDLWINEGFTSYVENRIMESVYGKDRAVMEQVLAHQGILEEMQGLTEKEQSLYNQSDYSDPDAAFSGVPYTKGQLLLHTIENIVGREAMDAFLRQYFNDHRFQSLSTEEWLSYIDTNLIKQYPGKISLDQIKEWVYQPGLPSWSYVPQSNRFKLVDNHISEWTKDKQYAIPFNEMSVHEKLHFINNLPEGLNQQAMAQLDKQFQLTQSSNAEIAFAWYKKSIANNYNVEEAVKSYLGRIGRMKFIVPLYADLAKVEKNKSWLGDFYRQNKKGYHPIAQVKIERKLKENNIAL